ncbi:hypothetical protein ACTXJG_15965 [Glutamicibacter arilaitensis]|uniref:hypothetical protein n=1 Tax=Glutamicibacter arilaitensis TaxID=256701 RepID=UPI003FD0853F
MLFKNVSIDGTSGFELTAIADGDEIVPKIDCLIFDAAPAFQTPEKTLIAGCLLFGEKNLTRVSVTDDVASSFLQQVQEILGLEKRETTRNEFQLGAIGELETKIKATTLRISLRGEFPESTPGRDATTLTLVPSERYSGVLWGIKEVIVASNAWLLEKTSSRTRIAAAAGVFFAEEFLAKSICVPRTSNNEELIIRNLCNLIGLDVVFEGE